MSVGLHTARGHAVRRPQNKKVCRLICRAGNVYPQVQVLCVFSAHEFFAGVDPPASSSRVSERKQMTHTAIATAGHHHFGFVV